MSLQGLSVGGAGSCCFLTPPGGIICTTAITCRTRSSLICSRVLATLPPTDATLEPFGGRLHGWDSCNSTAPPAGGGCSLRRWKSWFRDQEVKPVQPGEWRDNPGCSLASTLPSSATEEASLPLGLRGWTEESLLLSPSSPKESARHHSNQS